MQGIQTDIFFIGFLASSTCGHTMPYATFCLFAFAFAYAVFSEKRCILFVLQRILSAYFTYSGRRTII